MYTGLLQGMDTPCVFLTSKASERLGIVPGTYVTVESDDRGTVVTRAVQPIQTSSEVRDYYLYLDPESLRYLGTELHEEVNVRKAAIPLESP